MLGTIYADEDFDLFVTNGAAFYRHALMATVFNNRS